jgi:hypothetical protein
MPFCSNLIARILSFNSMNIIKTTKSSNSTTRLPANFELKVVAKSNNIFINNPVEKNKNKRIK